MRIHDKFSELNPTIDLDALIEYDRSTLYADMRFVLEQIELLDFDIYVTNAIGVVEYLNDDICEGRDVYFDIDDLDSWQGYTYRQLIDIVIIELENAITELKTLIVEMKGSN